MKGKILISILAIMLVIITGCDKKEEEKEIVCNLDLTPMTGTTIKSEYKITYTKDYVNRIQSKEEITSDNELYLETTKNEVEKTYSDYKDIKYYDYDVKIDGDTLTSTADINYAKIDTDELIKKNKAMSLFIKNGKFAVEDAKTMYETLGAKCK